MDVFLTTQLDFILFFYGLAFILLGSVCLGIARAGRHDVPWIVLASFSFAHGAGEWLDLIAFVAGDTPTFEMSRTALMTGSFVVLLEFSRLEALRLGLKVPGRWIYAPAASIVLLGGILGGVTAANIVARYSFGLTGAIATGLVLALHSRGASRSERRWIIFGVLGFVTYGLAAGAVVPAAEFWPADVVNYNAFIRVTGMPIQFVRGLLACWIAFSIWGFWGQKLSRDVGSQRYTAFLQRQFVWTLVALSAVLVFGWGLTEYLGGIYAQNVEAEARGDLDLLASRLGGETATVDGLVRALAGAQSVQSLVGGKPTGKRVASVLSMDVEASGAESGFVLDRSGEVVASFGSQETSAAKRPNYSPLPDSESSDFDGAGHYFDFSPVSGKTYYSASYPIRAATSEVTGTAVLKKSLEAFEADLLQFNRTFYLVDPHGVVVMTNRPNMLFRTLWPLSPDVRLTLSRQFGALNDSPVLDSEIKDATWGMIDGQRDYLRRRQIDHTEWSLVTLTPPGGLSASRILGIIITLQMTTLILVYLVGRERWMHDNVQMSKRLELEELARNLDFRATTDPLTGLYNRRKFNQELAIEIMRSQRYKTPFSIVLYDVDYFKKINDAHGHQIGDDVLKDLSRFFAAHIRSIDVHARWGGEEFIILASGASEQMAGNLANNLRDAARAAAFNAPVVVTCSFGVAEFEIGDTAETLVARADAALYVAKSNGRNRVELASGLGELGNKDLATVA